jgi:cytochrome c oxidase subunit 1
VVVSAIRGEVAGDNPWNALTPEWLTSSPPPVENWIGEAPLVTHPYGYGAPTDRLDLQVVTAEQIWNDRTP